jgi:hypothetical protein
MALPTQSNASRSKHKVDAAVLRQVIKVWIQAGTNHARIADGLKFCVCSKGNSYNCIELQNWNREAMEGVQGDFVNFCDEVLP